MRIGQTTVVHFSSKFLGSILGFVATVYFARELGDVVLGQYSLVMALVAWLGIMKSIGVSGAMVKRISEDEEPDKYLMAGTILMAVLVGLSILAIFLFRDYVNQYVGIEAATFVIIILIAKFLWTISKSSLQGSHLVHVYSILSAGSTGLQSLIQIGLVLVGFGLTGMIYGYTIGLAIASLIGLWYIKPSIARPERRHFMRLFHYAKFSWLGGLQSKTYSWVDIAVLGFFVQTGLIGVYSVAWTIAQFLNTFGSSISASMFPEISKESFQENSEYVAHLVEDSLTYAGLFMIPGVVGGALIGERILRIYGQEFIVGDQVLIVLLLAMLFYSYMKQILNGLNAIDRPDLAFRANLIFIISNIIFNIALIYLFGWIGAAIATALSSIAGLSVALLYMRSELDFDIPYSTISHQSVAAILMGIIVYGSMWLKEAFDAISHNFLEVLLLVGIGVISYFAMLSLFSHEFRDTVRDNLTTLL